MKYLDLNSCSFFHQLHELVITNEAVLCCCCGGDLVHQGVHLPYRAINKPSRSLWVFLIILNYKSVSRGFLQDKAFSNGETSRRFTDSSTPFWSCSPRGANSASRGANDPQIMRTPTAIESKNMNYQELLDTTPSKFSLSCPS